MGWGDCGDDSEGRPIGYVFEAKCDHKGCEVKIDRGLSYACGGMHGTGHYVDFDCEKYFCSTHLYTIETEEGEVHSICFSCKEFLKLDEDDKIIGYKNEN
jgi:hypothetical protein